MQRMQEKLEVQRKLDQATGKVKDLITLEVKLEEAIEAKRSQLAENDPHYTAFGDFRDDKEGVRITYVSAILLMSFCSEACKTHVHSIRFET
jgi:hypothetical protein